MQNTRHMLARAVILCGVALLFPIVATSASPSSTDTAEVQALQKQVDELNQELKRLKNASDPTEQQHAMQKTWRMMQDHMRAMRQMPGMMAGGCANWKMMDPSMMGSGMMGPGMMGSGTTPGCPMMGHGMDMGSGMGMGSGMMGWAIPSGVTPEAYQKQMTEQMQAMRSQMAAISAEKDPAKREVLMQKHYDTMYRDMQTMRGMGWMWAPSSAGALPDANSKGAQLESKYCSQCHAAPAPSLHTQTEWASVTDRMRSRIASTGGTTAGVMVPSDSEFNEIVKYLDGHARGP
ncbi:MAG: hypothetical protein R3F24_00440 [Gammaproteobacteria bacterium]